MLRKSFRIEKEIWDAVVAEKQCPSRLIRLFILAGVHQMKIPHYDEILLLTKLEEPLSENDNDLSFSSARSDICQRAKAINSPEQALKISARIKNCRPRFGHDADNKEIP